MKKMTLLLLLFLAGSPFTAFAADAQSAKDAYKAEVKKADNQYAADKKLCAEESTSSQRMQCLRDASAEHNQALTTAKQKLAAESKAQPVADTKAKRSVDTKAKPAVAVCADCGQVIDVKIGTKEGKGGPIGIIGGGVAGALLGRQVGSGTGKDVATIAGAAGGAFAGNKVEEKMRSTKYWTVKVKLDTGAEHTFEFEQDPGYKNGDLIKLSGGKLTRR